MERPTHCWESMLESDKHRLIRTCLMHATLPELQALQVEQMQRVTSLPPLYAGCCMFYDRAAPCIADILRNISCAGKTLCRTLTQNAALTMLMMQIPQLYRTKNVFRFHVYHKRLGFIMVSV